MMWHFLHNLRDTYSTVLRIEFLYSGDVKFLWVFVEIVLYKLRNFLSGLQVELERNGLKMSTLSCLAE